VGEVRLEGFHAIKHALRFGADVREIRGDPEELETLVNALAPDLAGRFRVTHVQREAVAFARRPEVDVAAALRDPRPIVLLEEPRSLANMGACVRVAAAADVAAVLATGNNDPWHPDALRGAAGLHFALPVARLDALPDTDRPLVAVDPEGEDFTGALPDRAILAFGAERYGLSEALLARAGARIRIPMRDGVSSLNLATSVAAVLYAWRLSAR
jgi:TrmH family RNA methyltransferase